MEKFVAFIFIVLLTCCQGRQDVNTDNKKENQTSDHLVGTWNNGFDSASFIITQDSIYDFEHFKWTTYTQNGDTATFYYLPGEEFKTRLYKIHEDTLIHEVGVSKTKYWRRGELTDKSLNGFWTDGSRPNATFTIQGDIFRDVEHDTRTKFVTHGDSVTFLAPDPKEVYSAKMYLIHADTLVYEFSETKTKYWRFKD